MKMILLHWEQPAISFLDTSKLIIDRLSFLTAQQRQRTLWRHFSTWSRKRQDRQPMVTYIRLPRSTEGIVVYSSPTQTMPYMIILQSTIIGGPYISYLEARRQWDQCDRKAAIQYFHNQLIQPIVVEVSGIKILGRLQWKIKREVKVHRRIITCHI